MLKKIKLTNFRKHENVTIELTQGLNVIRGANEIGKSTICEAVGYAFYGARALRESLEAVVTWEAPVNTLKVEVQFEFAGVEGIVKRGKSGAECKYGETLVTGQTEVTKFFEQLLQTSAQMASNLQIASQGKVRGALDGGGAQAVKLIEDLADFSLFETIIDKIQTGRPSGNTQLVVDRLARLKDAAQIEVSPEPDDSEMRACSVTAAVLSEELAERRWALPAHQQAAREAQARQDAVQASITRAQAARQRLDVVRAELAHPAPEASATEAQAQAWAAALSDEKAEAERRKAYATPVPTCADTWAGTREEFGAELAMVKLRQAEANRAFADARVARASKLALLINEKNCSFCKKDLTQVPEVALRNAGINAEVLAYENIIAKAEAALAETKSTLAAMERISKVDNEIAAKFPSTYWLCSMETMPRSPVWKGPAPEAAGERYDYATLLQKYNASRAEVERWQGRQAALLSESEQLNATLAAQQVPSVKDADLIAKAKQMEAEVQELALQYERTAGHMRTLKGTYDAQVSTREAQIAAKVRAEASIAETEDELSKMNFYNELIRKVRQARPVVANKLWAVVLSGISHYTALGRNQPSIVTRGEDGFAINGKAVSGYSGSATDTLGLAIRLALVKTFLPNSPFMVMDEIAAACDDNRELDMLGMVMAADIPQVILVTHSSAAESFASNLIQL